MMPGKFNAKQAQRRMNELRNQVWDSLPTPEQKQERAEIEAEARDAGYEVRLYGASGFRVEQKKRRE